MDQNDSNNQTPAQDVVQDKEQSTSQNDNSVMGQSAAQDENTAVEQSASKDSATTQSEASTPTVSPTSTSEPAPQQAQPTQMGPVPQQVQPGQAVPVLQQVQPSQVNAAATAINAANANPSPVRKKIDHNKIRDAFGTVGLVAGIIAIFPTFTIPRLQYFSYVLAILSIVFSLICLIRRRMGVIPILGVMIGLLAFGLVLTQSDVLHHVGHNYDNPYANNK